MIDIIKKIDILIASLSKDDLLLAKEIRQDLITKELYSKGDSNE